MRGWSILALLVALCLALSGCGGGGAGGAEPTRLRFADSVDVKTIEALAGKRVSITGYMATVSPLDGAYAYLLNLPYQSCPFCVPNTTRLANTIAVYAKRGRAFAYTEQAVRATGTMEVGNFTDDYGYQYGYRLVDAELEVVDLGEVSEEYALWQSIASDGVVGEINAMFDYLYFACRWTEYRGSTALEDGTEESWYLYPGDAENYLKDADGFADKAADGYFPGLIAPVKAISATGLDDLVGILKDAQALEQYARGELAAKRYSYDEMLDKYVLDDAETLVARFDEVYAGFSAWLGKWEV